MFFELARILEAKKPAYFLFENVPPIRSICEGKVFTAILSEISRLGYCCEWQCIDGRAYVPQSRKRVFMKFKKLMSVFLTVAMFLSYGIGAYAGEISPSDVSSESTGDYAISQLNDEKEETPSDGQTIYEERSGVREGLSIPTTVNAALSMRKASAFSDELIDLVADRIFDLSGDYVDVSKYGLNADQATIKEYLSRERMTTSYYHKLVLRIADELDLSTREILHCLRYALLQKYGKESLEELMEWGTEEESFSTIDDHVDTYFDFEISDRTQSIENALSIDDNTYEWMIEQETKAMVEHFLSILTPKEAKVIRMRYGIGYDEPMTLEAIGSILNVTRERVRQIETKAMRRLVKRKEYLFEGKFFTDD